MFSCVRGTWGAFAFVRVQCTPYNVNCTTYTVRRTLIAYFVLELCPRSIYAVCCPHIFHVYVGGVHCPRTLSWILSAYNVLCPRTLPVYNTRVLFCVRYWPKLSTYNIRVHPSRIMYAIHFPRTHIAYISRVHISRTYLAYIEYSVLQSIW